MTGAKVRYRTRGRTKKPGTTPCKEEISRKLASKEIGGPREVAKLLGSTCSPGRCPSPSDKS
jgi:hypothetical protein